MVGEHVVLVCRLVIGAHYMVTTPSGDHCRLYIISGAPRVGHRSVQRGVHYSTDPRSASLPACPGPIMEVDGPNYSTFMAHATDLTEVLYWGPQRLPGY